MKHPADIESLKAAEVAKRLGLSRSYVHELIKGQKTPSLLVAAQIERHFGVPVSAWVSRLDPAAADEDRSAA
jgi:transcriptional regulator with XRE-family HTH domain